VHVLSKRLLLELPWLLSLVVAAAALVWANRGGAARLWSVCLLLLAGYISFLVRSRSLTSSTDWPLWGPITVMMIVLFGMALFIQVIALRAPLWETIITILLGGFLFIASNFLLVLMFPKYFWI
jgi:hypothetical protein